MSTSLPDLNALLGSRICHDLIGPIGAIGNGVELLLLAGSGRSDEVAMISESVRTLTARLRFFRVAFGVSRPGQTLARAEVLAILADLFPSGRISVEWISPPDLNRAEAKAVCLLLLCAERALRAGGRIAVQGGDDGWSMTLTSPRLREDIALWSLVAVPASGAAKPPGPGLEPAEVQFPLAARALAELGRPATIAMEPEQIRISF